jgi:hypothetical protein
VRPGIRADRVTPGSATLGREYATAIAPFSPLAQTRPGMNLPSVKDRGHATYAASSPIFRAPKTSLVQTECPSAPVVLDFA